ncbi:MAG: RDD family protein, partial [Vicinamibacteria bacterium]
INPTSATKKEIPIVSRVISIGRDPSNDLVLSDSMVSRRHAILEHRENQYILRDNNSSNGTLVNGDRVDIEKPLRDGDLVAIGSSRLLFQLDDTAEASLPKVAAASGALSAAPVRSHASPPRPAAHESPRVSTRPAGADEIRCQACGKNALANDRFCRACGKELAAESKSVVCGHCGTEVRLPAEFCGNCGKSLTGRERASYPSPRAQRPSHLDPDLIKGPALGSDEAAVGLPQKPRPRAPSPAVARTSDEPAGFGIRLLAFLVDEVILGIPLLLGGLAWMTSFVSDSASGASTGPSGFVSAAFLLYSLACGLYYVLFWGARGATPGKSLLGLTVRTESGETPIGYGRALLRLVGYMVSSALLGLGFLLILFSEDRLALHDRIAGTRVTRST